MPYKDPEKRREADRKWVAANPEKERERRRKWRQANSEKERERRRKWRQANPEKERESKRKRREANREKICEYNRQRNTGFSPEMVLEAQAVQGGKCAICEIPFTPRGRSRCCADHFHGSSDLPKFPRGLICNDCNITLGSVERYNFPDAGMFTRYIREHEKAFRFIRRLTASLH